MKAKKVHESLEGTFKPKSKEEIKKDLPLDNFRKMVQIGNERIHNDFLKDVDFPVISDIWVEIYSQNYLDPDKIDVPVNLRPIPNGKMDLVYNEAHGRSNAFYWIHLKYKNKFFNFMQEEGNDFMTPITKSGNPLYVHKIYNFEDLIKYLEENYYSK